MKFLLHLVVSLVLLSCSAVTADKHLNERTFKTGDITVKWYQISEITSIHDFVDIERFGWTKTIMKANTDGICNILINGDTVIIQAQKNSLIYDLTAKTLNCYVQLDTSITTCQ